MGLAAITGESFLDYILSPVLLVTNQTCTVTVNWQNNMIRVLVFKFMLQPSRTIAFPHLTKALSTEAIISAKIVHKLYGLGDI